MCSSFCYNEYCVQYSFCILAKILFVDLLHGSTHSGQGVFMTYANQFALTISSLDSSDRALLTMNCSVMKVSMCVSRCPFDYPNLAQDAYTRLRKAQILEIIYRNRQRSQISQIISTNLIFLSVSFFVQFLCPSTSHPIVFLIFLHLISDCIMHVLS